MSTCEKRPPLDLERFGFRFGAAVVYRCAELPEGRVVIGVKPDEGEELSIYVSRTGRSVRVFRGGVELK